MTKYFCCCWGTVTGSRVGGCSVLLQLLSSCLRLQHMKPVCICADTVLSQFFVLSYFFVLSQVLVRNWLFSCFPLSLFFFFLGELEILEDPHLREWDRWCTAQGAQTLDYSSNTFFKYHLFSVLTLLSWKRFQVCPVQYFWKSAYDTHLCCALKSFLKIPCPLYHLASRFLFLAVF